MERWQKKVAVVTGASSGIGAAIAKVLVEEGMIVVGLARRMVKMKTKVLATISADKQHNFHCFKCDVTDEPSVREVFDWIHSHFGGIDVLVNNAGCARKTTLLGENNLQDIKDTMDINVMGVVWCTREAFRSMKQCNMNGHILNINSVAGHYVPTVPGMNFNIYPATKFAITAMSEVLRQEFMAENTKIKITFSLVLAGNELWPMERPDGMPNIVSLEVMCGKDHMDVHLTFSHPFEGIVSSKGQHSDPRCVYVPPSTGKTFFSFRISYSRCGTKPDLNGQFYENTVVVQYDKDLLEVWDEAKRLRCEWFNDYEKTASKPPMVIADLDVIQLDFRGDNVDCWMEIQHGKGPWAPPVSGIVPLGSTLTLVVAINDYRGEFDMRVKSCVASDGSGHVINLSDEFGCVLRPKMISRFLKARAPDERATVITYAFFHAFKFPDALSVHIKCKVEICRHGCLDHCQLNDNANERKDVIINDNMINQNNLMSDMGGNGGGMGGSVGMVGGLGGAGLGGPHLSNMPEQTNDMGMGNPEGGLHDHDIFYDDIIHNRKQLSQINSGIANILDQFNNVHEKNANIPPRPVHEDPEEADLEDIFGEEELADLDEAQYMELRKSGKFPHGPRQLAQKRMGVPMAGPRSLEPKDKDSEQPRPVYRPKAEALKQTREDHIDLVETEEELGKESLNKTEEGKPRRRRRSVVISDRKVRSADVGVSGLYDVISEADLAFAPDVKQEAVTVFQGKISEEVVYGICMPVPGFSILFIVVISATIVSALIAGSLLYRYQLQKEALEKQTPMPLQGTLASWMTLRLFRMREQQQQQSAQNAAAVAVVQSSLAAAAAAASLTHETVQ